MRGAAAEFIYQTKLMSRIDGSQFRSLMSGITSEEGSDRIRMRAAP